MISNIDKSKSTKSELKYESMIEANYIGLYKQFERACEKVSYRAISI